MLSFLMFLFIALFPSVIGAISGIGGGIIIKPVLDMVVSWNIMANSTVGIGIEVINFLSGCTVLTMSSISLLRSRKTSVRLESGRGTALAVGAVIGGISGKLIFSLMVLTVEKNLIGSIQSLTLIIMTFGVMLYMRKKESFKTRNIQFLPFCMTLGFGLGLVSAFLGIGGGPINIMIISFFLSMDSKTSALHSLFVIFLSQLASLILTLLAGIPPVPLSALIAMIMGGASGGLIGSQIVRLMRNGQVDKLFSILMIVVMAVSVYNFVNFISYAAK